VDHALIHLPNGHLRASRFGYVRQRDFSRIANLNVFQLTLIAAARVVFDGGENMTQQLARHRFLTVLFVIGSLALVGVTPALADELPADGGSGDACTQRTADAYTAIDTYESSLPANGVVTETDRIRPVQAIVSQLNFGLSRMDCATETPK
jgi:hypothetical protein